MSNDTPSTPAIPKAARPQQPIPPLTLLEFTDPGIQGLDSYSPLCMKIHRALKYAKLPYSRRFANNPNEHSRYNPTGQVPVLLIGEEAVPDSTRILRRLCALAPDRLRASPEAWLWEELADTSLYLFVGAARWADDANWSFVRDVYFSVLPGPIRGPLASLFRRKVIKSLVSADVWRAGPKACWERFNNLLDDLDGRAPETGFWLGEELSIADISLFAQLHSFRTPLSRGQADSIAARRRLTAWLDRVGSATV